MALTGGTLWEVRTGGNDANGAGFYNRDPGTSVDYTEQDAAQATFTNLTTAGAGATTITDGDTGGLFTAAMAGNLIYIASGTNFTAGYYEIVTFTDGDNVVLDRSPTPGAAGSSGAGKVGGGRLTIPDAFLEGVSAGDTIWMEAGTYAQGASLSISKDGTITAPITVEGYNSSRGDDPTDASRPLWQMGTWTFYINGDHWRFKNIRFTTSQANGIRFAGSYCKGENLAVVQSTNNSAAMCYYVGTGGQLINSEGESDNSAQGYGVQLQGAGSKAISCYFHDLETGIYTAAANGFMILFNITEDCSVNGIWLGGGGYQLVWLNTIDGNGVGIQAANQYGVSARYNAITNNTTGASATAANESNDWDFNNWYGNTADVSNVTKGDGALAVDPKYTNAAGDDFSLASDSTMRDVATTISIGVG